MNCWFECKVSYVREIEKGKQKKVTENYLVEALNFSEAEARVSEQVAPFMTGDFSVSGIRKSNVNEIFPNNEGDKLYRIKLAFITIDEVSAKEKRVNSNVMIFGTDLRTAIDNLLECMKESMADFEIAEVKETNILDIYPYEVPADAQPKSEEDTELADVLARAQAASSEIKAKLSDEDL